MRQTISLAMIMKNEESVLQRCLDSFKNIVDEIVIVDTGSTDRSKEIALQYTPLVYDFEWKNDFAAARNFSFSLCTKDFIMWCDADDVITEVNQKKFKELDLSDKEIVLFKYNYSHDEFGKAECVLERERIVKRSLGLKWQKRIHEYLPLNGRLFRADIETDHWKKSSSTERNLLILEEIVKTDNDPRNLFYFGKECADAGRIEQAIESLKKFVLSNGWWEDVFTAYEIIAKCYLFKNDEENFLKNIFKSISIEPRRAEPYYELGEFYTNRNDWSRAIHWFEMCLNVKRSPELLSTYYPQYYTWKPALWLCICYNNIGDVQKAYEYNELFLKFRPNDKRGINNRQILVSSPKRRIFKEGQRKKLNLGCGSKRLEGYVNVDILKTEYCDEIFSINQIPYVDNSISSIYCEHVLEHVSFEESKKSLEEFFRVLEPGGELQLFIPDLELCCQGFLNGNNSKTINGYPEKQWYKMTLFGAQKDENGSIADYQHHLCGFNKEEIKELLESTGFIIDYLDNY